MTNRHISISARLAVLALAGLLSMPLTVYADPPSWAPAHGWRDKHQHDRYGRCDHDRYDRDARVRYRYRDYDYYRPAYRYDDYGRGVFSIDLSYVYRD